MNTLKFKIRRLGSLLVLFLVIPCPTLASDAIEYCTDLSYFGDYGAMSFAVTTDDDADTAVVKVVAGYARGWRFEGTWDGESGIGSGAVVMSEDPLMGTFGFDTEYRNSILALGPNLSLSMERAFSTPPDFKNRIKVRCANQPKTVFTTSGPVTNM